MFFTSSSCFLLPLHPSPRTSPCTDMLSLLAPFVECFSCPASQTTEENPARYSTALRKGSKGGGQGRGCPVLLYPIRTFLYLRCELFCRPHRSHCGAKPRKSNHGRTLLCVHLCVSDLKMFMRTTEMSSLDYFSRSVRDTVLAS